MVIRLSSTRVKSDDDFTKMFLKVGLLRPTFTEPIPNVTVAVGRDAALPCVVDNLGTHRVSLAQTSSLATSSFLSFKKRKEN